MKTFGKILVAFGIYGAVKIYGKVKYISGILDAGKAILKGSNNKAKRPVYRRYSDYKKDIFLKIFSNKQDAESVCNDMDKLLAEYGQVTIVDYYDLIGSNIVLGLSDGNLGWTKAVWLVTRLHDGWTIIFTEEPTKVG